VQPVLPPPMRPLLLLCPLPMLVPPVGLVAAARHPLDFTLSLCTQDFISISLRVSRPSKPILMSFFFCKNLFSYNSLNKVFMF
jgi:hypothetical protein